MRTDILSWYMDIMFIIMMFAILAGALSMINSRWCSGGSWLTSLYYGTVPHKGVLTSNLYNVLHTSSVELNIYAET